MDQRHYRAFCALARSGNYLEASFDLGISQSQLSKLIMAAEKELGAELVDRSRRKMRITPAGELFLEYSKACLVAHERLLSRIRRLGAEDGSLLRIIAIPALSPYGIPRLLTEFRAFGPEWKVKLEEAEADSLIQALQSAQADLAFMREPFVDKQKCGFWAVDQDRLVIVVPETHPLALRESVELEELASESLVLMGDRTLLKGYIAKLCLSAGFPPRIAHESGHADNVIELVSQGLGLGILMEKLARHFSRPNLRIVPIRGAPVSRIGFAWIKGPFMERSLEAFLGFLLERGIAANQV